jgi:hypothetical protein
MPDGLKLLSSRLSRKGSGKRVGEGPSGLSGCLNFRQPLQLRSARPDGHGSGSIFGGERARSCGYAAECSKRGHVGQEIPVFVLGFDADLAPLMLPGGSMGLFDQVTPASR